MASPIPHALPNNETDAVGEAMKLIVRGALPHPLPSLLHTFVSEALDQRLAADYVLRVCASPDDPQALRNDLLGLVSDWRQVVEAVSKHGSTPPMPDAQVQAAITAREGNRCSVTGKHGTSRDPLIVAPILPIPTQWAQAEPPNPRIFNMLGAFFGGQYRDWWLAYCRHQTMDPHHTHWLIRKSAAKAFGEGLVALNRLQPSMVEYLVENNDTGSLMGPIDIDGHVALLGDHSRRGLKKVDPRFVGTHYRLSQPMRWLAVAEQMARNRDPKTTAPGPVSILTRGTTFVGTNILRSVASSITGLLKSTFLAFWRVFPAKVRAAAYRLLRAWGRRLYGPSKDLSETQRLPFGLFLKYGDDPEMARNEYNALRAVHQHTSVPAPEPIDLAIVSNRTDGGWGSQESFLVTTRLPGRTLALSHHMMSDEDNAAFITQMQEYIKQLRAIPKTVNPGHAICNTLGGPIRDTRIRDADPQGPFVDEAAFNEIHRFPDDPGRSGHEICFTHADLNFRNILVDLVQLPDGTRGWRVTGIVDWEMAGFLPEYWEYTKSLYERVRYTRRIMETYHTIFNGLQDYSKEYEVEVRSWEAGYN